MNSNGIDEKIIFNAEEIDFQLENEYAVCKWIDEVIRREAKKLGSINYIFCTDDYLHALNVEYLEHDTLTDVITFPYNENPIEGDIFISIDRVRDNANDLKVPFQNELFRVIIHGALHLCGYLDETDEQEEAMRNKEDECLKLYFN